MAGSTIDHLIALTTFLVAYLIFVSLFSQTIQTAILYQQHRQLAIKCSNILDTILLTPGIPPNWGETNLIPSSFGLQHPNFGGYTLSPFSVLRLSPLEEHVYYNRTGEWYSNYSLGEGVYLLLPLSSSLNYSMVATLLGINGSYGFQLVISPLINVEAHAVDSNPLTIEVYVSGISDPISGANVTCYLYRIYKKGHYPAFIRLVGNATTGDDGRATIEFSGVNVSNEAYVAIIRASIGNFVSVGYIMKKTTTNEDVFPFIVNFEERKIMLAHSWDVHHFGPPEPEISYNATFFFISESYTLSKVEIENSTGMLTYGVGKAYSIITIPTFDPGFLIITYRATGNKFGVTLMPWGISSLSVSVTFGELPTNAEWVATDIRLVIINGMPYQVKLALWSLEGYQVVE